MQIQNLLEAATDRDIVTDSKVRYGDVRCTLTKTKSSFEIVNSANRYDDQSKSEALLGKREFGPSGYADVKVKESSRNCKSAEPILRCENSLALQESSTLIGGHRANDQEFLEAEKRILEDINRLDETVDNIIEVLPWLKGYSSRCPKCSKKLERKRIQNLSSPKPLEYECQTDTDKNNNTLNLVTSVSRATSEIHRNTPTQTKHFYFFITIFICLCAVIFLNTLSC